VTASEAFPPDPQGLVAYFWSGEHIRSRSVGASVQVGTVVMPAPPLRLVADWQREIETNLRLALGGVEPISLPRARLRWAEYRQCVQAAAEWTRSLGLPDVLAPSEIALMACRGANYHIDAEQYGSAVFCNLFLSEDRGLDVHFPGTGQRIPLVRGTVLVFDTAQPHAVIPRGRMGFDAEDFGAEADWNQIFLTWELSVEIPAVAQVMGIAFDTDPVNCEALSEEQVWLNGTRVCVSPDRGDWLPAAHLR
jgi:hypothetical protein